MAITTKSSKLFERILLNIVEKENVYIILTPKDDLTKFTRAYLLVIHNANFISKNMLKVLYAITESRSQS